MEDANTDNMNIHTITNRLATIAEEMDDHGDVLSANALDEAIRLAYLDAAPYDNEREPPFMRSWPYSEQEDELEKRDNDFWYERPQRKTPEYRALPGNEDTDEDMGANEEEGNGPMSMFDMHGQDAVKGPAYVDDFSPRDMSTRFDGLEDFSWENQRDEKDNPDESFKRYTLN